MYFRHWLLHIKKQHSRQSILFITLKWTFLICSTAKYSLKHPLFFSRPIFIYLPPFLPSSQFPSLFFHISLLLPLFLFLCNPPSFSLIPYLSIFSSLYHSPSPPLPSTIVPLPFLYSHNNVFLSFQ